MNPILHLSELPRERLKRIGPEALTLRECLALVLGMGNKQLPLHEMVEKILPADLSEAEFFERWSEMPALGEAQTARLLAVREISKRYAESKIRTRRSRVLSCGEAASLALGRIPARLRLSDSEWLGFIPIDREGRVGHLQIVEHGVRTHVNTDPALFFYSLLRARPTAFVLAHLHPSGDVQPSFQDHQMTWKVGAIASELGISLLGHWIVSASSEFFFSSKDGEQDPDYAD